MQTQSRIALEVKWLQRKLRLSHPGFPDETPTHRKVPNRTTKRGSRAERVAGDAACTAPLGTKTGAVMFHWKLAEAPLPPALVRAPLQGE